MTTKIKYNIPLIVKARDSWDGDPDYITPTPEVAQRAADDFNSAELQQYSDLPYLKKLTAEAQGNKLIATAEIDGRPTKTKVVAIQKEISGQCSDGWGEGFEQQEFSGRTLGYGAYKMVFISTWDRDKEPEAIIED